MRSLVFRVFYLLIFCACLALIGMKLVASIWKPEWDSLFYTISGVLGVIAIGRLALKAVRLELAELRLRRKVIVLHPLHYQLKKPLTIRRASFQTVRFATMFSLLTGGIWYAQAHHLLPFQAQASRVCVSQPSPMPKIANDVPALKTWQKRGSAGFDFSSNEGFSGTPSLAIRNATGTAAWAYAPHQELAGNTYQYADWYRSDVQTSLVLQYTLNGTTKEQTIDAHIPATKGWRHYSAAFDMPDNPGASDFVPVTVMQQITGRGSLEISGVVLHLQTSAFVRPLISVTFDDGWRTQYTNALPLLCQYKIPATFYLVSKYIERGYPDYLLPNMVSKLVESGMEIGDHTVDHPSLPLLSSAAAEAEIADSKTYLEQFGSVVDFASPYGAVNDEDIRLIKKLYQSHRSTDVGVNTADEFDPYNLMCVTIDANEQTGSFTQIQPFIDVAIKTGTWLILAFHQIAAPGEKYFTDPFNASPDLLEEVLSYIRERQMQPVTINQGLSEVFQQI
jgi:peptidoglycan/xylan/chitin deacetylase (PgdA/CDA1 family)